ncbi:MAG: VanZ family protein [Clostridia bacterium]|nr:VanZ family protein [Clostridia bacterium]
MAKMSKDRKIILILRCAVILLLAFIWGHSLMNAGDSTQESDAVKGFLTKFFELFVGKGNVTSHLVRKVAHFTEFSALGVLFEALLHAHRKKTLFYQSYALMAGVSAALIDETLQFFSEGRSAKVEDVLLDGAGVLFGLLLCSAVFLIARTVRKSRAKKKTEGQIR